MAALMVIFFHYTGWQPGFLGVDLFFIISGFVIAGQKTTPGNFLWHRFLRLYPAFFVCCIATYLLTFSVSFPAFLANLAFIYKFTGSLAVDGAYWSLVAEIQFYLAFAVILAFRLNKYIVPMAFGWLSLAMLQNNLHLHGFNTLLLAPWTPFFTAGIALRSKNNWLWTASVASGLFMMPTPLFGLVMALLFTAAAIACQLAGKPRFKVIGGVTYPLYLLHQYIGRAYMPYIGLLPMLFVAFAMAFTVYRMEPYGRNLINFLKPKGD